MTRLRPAQTIGGQGLSSLASGLIVATLIIVFLYVGREILEPLVIAVLIGFILAPLIRHLRNLGLWRVPSVILAVLFARAVIGALVRPSSCRWRSSPTIFQSTRPICAPRYERSGEER